MASIKGKEVVLQLSQNGSTWKQIVCEVGHSLNLSRSTNSVETKCYGGTVSTSVGALSGTIDFTGIFETQPSATDLSGDDILGYLSNANLLFWREMHGVAGDELYRSGRGYVTSYTEDKQVADSVTCDFTLTIDGAVAIAP